MNSKPIYQVCAECGISANVLTCLKKYGAPPIKLCFSVSTYHFGYCDFCSKQKEVTEVRDFFFPDFDLLREVMQDSVKHNHGGVIPFSNHEQL